MTEEELVQRCCDGDRQAQSEFYARTSRRIYRLLLRMTGSEEAASDLAQETYLRAFARIGDFDARSTIATWLYRIAVNEALQHRRRLQRERGRLESVLPDVAAPGSQDRHAAKLDVAEALSSLAPDDRAVLLLRYQEGLDYRRMATVLDCAEGTVASRLNRARAKLGELLGEGYAVTEETRVGGHPI
ncbi:MAG: sigma-70 family RNA polymerase sigma factor [Planctomycetes bacterium]|nr:sigma-70 family RNA polymerase sigma factor [Planctomycetota bacterium]